MRLTVVGTGYVGLVTGACFADMGHDVTCVDIDEAKIAKLRTGEIPIHEPGLEDVVARTVSSGHLSFTTDLADGLVSAEVVFVCVQTPSSEDGSADLSAVETVARQIGGLVTHDLVVVNKSTVPVGSASLVERLIASVAHPGAEIAVASNPEFLREGSAVHDFLHPDRVVVGTTNERAIQVLSDLYRPLGAPILVTSPETAELIKYASNAFLATKISFINAISQVCDAVGADVLDVAQGMGHDPRIGFEFLRPGPGFGGSCFPKDVRALIAAAEERGMPFDILKGVLRTNETQRDAVIAKIASAVGDLNGARIGVWGLAFKANTDDVRESPAIEIVAALRAAGATVRAYDPAVSDRVYADLGIDRAADPIDAVSGVDALAILSEWDEFRWVDLSLMRAAMAKPSIVDARNLLDPQIARGAGFIYTGIGR